MSRVLYNKLIRDKVPEKMRSKSVTFEVRTLDDAEFEIELLKKVEEEASALPLVTSHEELVDELADVLDVIEEIQRVKEVSTDEIRAARERNTEKKGGFAEKQFLLWTEDDGYQTNEKRRDSS